MGIIKSEHIALRTQPRNLNILDMPLFEHEFSKKINATTLETVHHVEVVKDTVFKWSELKFYTEYTHVTKLTETDKLKRVRLLLKPGGKADKGIWIIDNWSLAYFHWLTDALTRLIAAEKHLDDHIVFLPSWFDKNPYADSLRMLGVKVKFFDISRRIHVNEMVFPSHTAPTGNYNKEIINKLRTRFSISNGINPTKKIYISRQRASRRKITNEAEVAMLVKTYGFEIHFFEDYNFQEQVRLMNQASHLIGLHGAGLTNMLFMPKNGKVLELRNRNDAHNNCFFSLASDLEHNYYYQLNEGNTIDTHVVDITVNIENLANAIDQMMA